MAIIFGSATVPASTTGTFLFQVPPGASARQPSITPGRTTPFTSGSNTAVESRQGDRIRVPGARAYHPVRRSSASPASTRAGHARVRGDSRDGFHVRDEPPVHHLQQLLRKT